MSVLSKRLFTLVAISLGIGSSALALSAVVIYKPWGVHDLRRGEYEKILERIEYQHKVVSQPRPIAKLTSFENPQAPQLPGAKVESIAEVRNLGDQPLQISAPKSWPLRVEPIDEYPVEVLPKEKVHLRFSWLVPSKSAEMTEIAFDLTSNDPLNQIFRIEPTCTIAAPFLLEQTTIGVAESSNSSVHVSNYLFSQRFDNFSITDVESDERIIVDIESIVDKQLLEQHQAKSGVKINVTDPQGRKRGSYVLPITFTAFADGYSETLSFTLNEKRRSATTFFGPELDVRQGLAMGVIERNSVSSWTFFARIDREEALTDVSAQVVPDVFDVQLAPARRGSNDYRITLRLKEDATPVDFQASSRGYVRLTSETDPTVDNSIPITGVVIPLLSGQR